MLFGPKSLRDEFVRDIEIFSEKEEIIPIFATVLSSIACGTQTKGSDYDARGLYIEKDSTKRYDPRLCKESELRKRFYPEEEKLYDWIGMWEYSSFFQFLATPSFQGDFSEGLYRNVPLTLYSPYTWDPYGIIQKIDPFVRECYNPLYMTKSCLKEFYRFYHGKAIDYFHKEEMKPKFSPDDSRIPTSYYLKAIHEMLCIDWMMEYNSFHPWYFKSMLPVLPREVSEEIQRIIEVSKHQKDQRMEKGEFSKNIDIALEVVVEKSPIITAFFDGVLKKLEKRDDIQNFKAKESIQETVDYIQYLIEYSVFHEEKLLCHFDSIDNSR